MLRWMGTTFAAGLIVAVGGTAWADDTVRLGGPSAHADIVGGTDTELVHRRGGGWGGGGWGGGGWGRGGGWGGGGWGGGWGRGGWGGGWGGGGWGNRYYTPYFSAGFYARPQFYNSYYPSYYQPYTYASYSYYPCAGEAAPVMTLQAQASQYYAPSQLLPAPQRNVPLMPPASSLPGNFQYDGGPNQPLPMPGVDVNPAKAPRAIIPIDGKLVSLPSGISGGFSPVTLTAQPRTSVNNSVPRVTYPAYGEHR